MNQALMLTDEQLFERMMNLPQEKFNSLIFMKLNEFSNIKKDVIETKLIQDSEKARLDKVIEKTTYFEDNNFKNLTNLGMDFLPQISNQAMRVLLHWLKLTKYNSTNRNYIPVQEALNRNYARETMTKEINGKSRINYHYNSIKIQEYTKKKLGQAGLLDQFEKHISSQERNNWIRENLII